jgi:CheY-like chemotaxis protein
MTHHASSALRILLVDDEPANLDLLERALSRDGHQCIRAASGEAALERFAEAEPDLVFMDVMLPGLDGFETTRRLRRQRQERWIPIIFLSALNTPIDIVTGLDAGGDDYLSKPVDLMVLRSKVETSQRLVALHRQLQSKSQQLQRYFEESEAEKHLAADLMRHLRREGKPPIPGVDFHTVPAIDFSGDIIAVAETPDGRLHLMLADAAGHGLVAAMNVQPAVEIFYRMTDQGHSMPRIIERINNALRDLIPGHRFVSALFAMLDSQHATIEVWNAGIPTALLADDGGRVLRRFGHHLLPLGIDHFDADALESEIDVMAAGQRLVACSDGLIEATNHAGAPFGEDGLIAALPEAFSQTGCAAIMTRLRAHSGTPVFDDDVSVLLARQPPPPRLVGRSQMAGEEPHRCDQSVGFAMDFGPEQLRRLVDVAPRFMMLAQSHFALTPATYQRLYRVVRQLADNAIDWGLLGLSPSNVALPPVARRQLRRQAMATLGSGHLHMAIHACQCSAGRRSWEVVIQDSGPGFDADKALARSMQTRPAPGGLALVADESLLLRIDPPGNRVRVWLPE